MIISHKFKYLFVALPLTGSTAISKELCEQYDGVSILDYHATYLDFLRVATEEEKKYFVFSGIRNPLDVAVSTYFKYKQDHKGWFTNPEKLKQDNMIVRLKKKVEFGFVQKNDPDFATFFKRFYAVPYNNWSSLSHKNIDYIIRFENITNDFAQGLRLIGIEQKRPLPVSNKTSVKENNYLTYYSPEIIPRAKRVFGPFMQEWDYEFPAEWGDASISAWTYLEFYFVNIFRNFYWKHIRHRI